MKDLFGKAILDYQTGNAPENIITETSISEEDEMSVAYLFRDYSQMPKLEQKALQMAEVRVLDAGCGAGSHALYLQDQRKLEIVALDISESAITACRLRGVKNTVVSDILSLENEKFDTILLLMNGTGIVEKLSNISVFLQKLKSLLNEGGQVLVDSSDIIYMFDTDEDGGVWIPSDLQYYGELTFTITYKGEKEEPFGWLYLDYNTLQNAAIANGFNCELVMKGDHYDYLARLWV